MLIKEKKELHGYWVATQKSFRSIPLGGSRSTNKRKSVPQIGKEHPLITVSRPNGKSISPLDTQPLLACAHCDPPEHF